jgi:hypothetical protein
MKSSPFLRRFRRCASLLAAAFLPLVSLEAQTLVRSPYLQNGSTSAVTVRWRTSTATDSVVRYGTAAGSLTQTVSVTGTRTEHEVRLTGLGANTTYFYSVGSTATTLASGTDYFFVTAPTGAKPTRVWVLGDPGTGSSSQTAVRNAYYSFTGTRHTDLWLMLGDNAYSVGSDSEYTSKLFNIYPTMLRKSVLWPTYGNHDADSSDSASQTGPYYAQHTLPKQGEAGGVASGTEAYYSFDYGNIHFICLDSSETSRSATGAMANWLRSDLAANTKDWTIAFWHHPPYSKGSHNSDSETALIEMRTNFLPILESYGVDLVLGGHSHAYERSYFINGHYGNSSTFNSSMIVQSGNGRTDGNGAYTKTAVGQIPNSGAVYTVAGSSGQISGGTLNHAAMFLSLNVLGSVVLDFDGGRLDVQFIDSTGARRDYFTIDKTGGAPNTPPTVSLTAPAAGSTYTAPVNITLDATAADANGTVTKVDFYAGTTLLGTDTTSPYSFVWNNAPVGAYSLTARATDNSGAVTTSAAVAITVTGTGPTTVSFQDGVNGYAGTRDTTIRSDAVTTNYGTATTLLMDGSPDYAALIKWDLSSIPAGKTVTAVTIAFNVVDSSSGTFELYALKRDWTETGATWNQFAAGSAWQTVGANGANDRETVACGAATGNTGVRTVTLNATGIAKVQAWINAPATNYGFAILDYAVSNGLDVSSSEAATATTRPRITITYQ